MRHLRSLAAAGVVATVVPLLVTGCSGAPDTGPVSLDSPSVDSPSLDQTDQAACRRFLADLPSTLANQPRRAVTPATALGAAWGDPALVLRCGVAVPTDFDELSRCVEVNEVGWYVPEAQRTDESSEVTWTAVGYRPIVQIEVPPDYRPEGAAAVIAALAGPVQSYLTLVQACH